MDQIQYDNVFFIDDSVNMSNIFINKLVLQRRYRIKRLFLLLFFKKMKNVFWVKIVDEIIGIYLYCNIVIIDFLEIYMYDLIMNYVINVI